ncbi:ATP-binding protein [Thermosulfuriphilus sp.]
MDSKLPSADKAPAKIVALTNDVDLADTLKGLPEDIRIFEDSERCLHDGIHIDLVLLDLETIPDVFSEIRRMQWLCPEAPIIGFISPQSRSLAVQALAEGLWAYLLKPLDLQELQPMVQQGLRFRELVRFNRQCQVSLEWHHLRLIHLLQLTTRLSTAFLQAADRDELLGAILVGITVGEGLGFNRAFLCLVDEGRRLLKGEMAIGPSSPEEARQIWAEIDRRRPSLFEILEDYQRVARDPDLRVNQLVKRIEVSLEDQEHLLIRCLRERRPYSFTQGRRNGRGFAELVDILGVEEFALVPLVSHEREYGLIITDNFVTRRPISQHDLEFLQLFATLATLGLEKIHTCQVLTAQIKSLEELNRKLEENKHLLVEAERFRAIGQTISRFLHEIRNPLSSMAGLARRLKEKEHPHNLDHYLEIIVREAERLELLLKDISHFVTPTSFKPCMTDLISVVEEILSLLAREMAEAKIVLKRDYQLKSLKILLDPDRFKEALIHLVMNAIEAMPEGGELTIRIWRDERYAVVEVIDTGWGIPRALVKKVGEPFFTTKPHGTGLGLFIARRALELHEARFCVYPNMPAGTRVMVHLPLREVEDGGA